MRRFPSFFVVLSYAQTNGRTLEIETAAQSVFQIPLVAEMHEFWVVDLYNESGRCYADFRAILYFEPRAAA